MFSGVDALILGTIIPRGQNVAITAKIIATDTAEIVGGAKTEFKADSSNAAACVQTRAGKRTGCDFEGFGT